MSIHLIFYFLGSLLQGLSSLLQKTSMWYDWWPVSVLNYDRATCSDVIRVPNPLAPQASTFLQLSQPKYQFWAARRGTCLPFSFFFSGHQNKNHSAQTWGLWCFFWTTASQDDFVGFNPLTILSGQGHISELVPQHSHFSDDWSS